MFCLHHIYSKQCRKVSSDLKAWIDLSHKTLITHTRCKSRRDDILAIYSRDKISHVSDDIVIVAKGLSKIPKSNYVVATRLGFGLGTVSTDMSSRWDSIVPRSQTERSASCVMIYPSQVYLEKGSAQTFNSCPACMAPKVF
jgi:hypothetical protein